MISKFSIALHGGAGTLIRGKMTLDRETEYRNALKEALLAGYEILEKGGSALDAVQMAVVRLEDCPLFNAGRGSVFAANGKHEMDASIMDGLNLRAGAIAAVAGVKNPILLARDVMEKSEHVLLAGEGAMDFAKSLGYQFENEHYFYDDYRYQQWLDAKESGLIQLDHTENKDNKFGTVGAVALDMNGNLAAATSTGGMTNKRFGRIGDSPVIGAGTYANNRTCAVSCTGSGEFFIRGVAAYDVSALMEYKGLSLSDAAEKVIFKRLKDLGGDGGLIAVDSQGNIAMPFNTEGMYRACKSNNGQIEISIYRD